MKLLELFAGTKSVSKVAEEMGWETFTSDVNKRFKTDYTVNVLDFDVKKVPFVPDVIWASPPCTWFSKASMWKHWDIVDGQYYPKTIFAQAGVEIVKRTMMVIEKFKLINPNLIWYIENPVGALRKLEIIEKAYQKISPFDLLVRHTVTYCSYSDPRYKPTDIWTNNPIWTPRPAAKVTDKLHTPDAVNQMSTPAQRATIPAELCREVLTVAALTGIDRDIHKAMSCANDILPGPTPGEIDRPKESIPGIENLDRSIQIKSRPDGGKFGGPPSRQFFEMKFEGFIMPDESFEIKATFRRNGVTNEKVTQTNSGEMELWKTILDHFQESFNHLTNSSHE